MKYSAFKRKLLKYKSCVKRVGPKLMIYGDGTSPSGYINKYRWKCVKCGWVYGRRYQAEQCYNYDLRRK